MTRYIAEILKQLGVDYLNYTIDNYWEESTDKNVISMIPKDENYAPDDIITIYWEDNSCYLYIENNLEIDEYGHISVSNPLFKKYSLPVFNLLLTPESILELWQNNKDSILYRDERFGSIYTTEIPNINYPEISEEVIQEENTEIEEGGFSYRGQNTHYLREEHVQRRPFI